MKKGAGGLVSTLLPIMEISGGIWIASAMNDADIEIASKFPGNTLPVPLKNPKFRVHLIKLNKEKYNEFYNTFSNSLLWFTHHQLWNLDK